MKQSAGGLLSRAMAVTALAAAVVLGCGPRAAHGQAVATATRAISLSVFAAGSERAPKLAGARNTDILGGLDISFLPVHGLIPSLELRGSWPIIKGNVVGENEFLGGLRLAKPLGAGAGRVRVYGNLLIGRGQIDYYGAGLQVPGMNVFYTESHSTVFSPGGGVEIGAGGNFALKLDAQIERYGTPVTASGSAWADVASVGVVYRLNFDGRRKK